MFFKENKSINGFDIYEIENGEERRTGFCRDCTLQETISFIEEAEFECMVDE